MSHEDFPAFLSRVRAGDERAAADLVQQYEAVIRREVRLRLTNPSVYRVVSDDDVCQSVLASFFVRATLGQYDLHDPAQLRQLLLSMARNKLAHAARRLNTQKRGGGRNAAEPVDEMPLPGKGSTPGSIAASRELLDEVRRRLTEEERRVADLRALGHDWAEIARQLGGTSDGRRMQLTRALDRVSTELGLDDSEE